MPTHQSDRPPSGFDHEIIDEILSVFQTRTTRKLNRKKVRRMANNLVRAFSVLLKWKLANLGPTGDDVGREVRGAASAAIAVTRDQPRCSFRITQAACVLRDLEEVLLLITDRTSREFMREAVRCYHAGAYRAAVVLAVAAGMDDLRRKLDALVASGSPPQAVLDGAKRIEQLFRDQKPFEKDLIYVASAGADMISPSEAKKLELLLQTRHLSAHPSGHRATAEEARDAVTSVVDIVLSRPGLLGAKAARDLFERVPKQAFFPKIAKPEDAFPVVQQELATISPDTMPMLSSLATKRVIEILVQSQNTHVRWLSFRIGHPAEVDAYTLFLGGMLQIVGEPHDAAVTAVARLVREDVAAIDACWLLSVAPALVSDLEALDRDRAVAMIRRNIANDEALACAKAWRAQALLAGSELADLIQAVIGALVPTNMAAVKSLSWPEVEAELLSRLVANARSSDWSTANHAISAIQGWNDEQVAGLSPEQRFEYVSAIAYQLGRDGNCAHAAVGMGAAGLGPRAHLAGEALDFLDGAATRTCDLGARLSWRHFADLCLASGYRDHLITAISGAKLRMDGVAQAKMRDALENYPDSQIQAAGRD